jgi:CBS domain-containing protein
MNESANQAVTAADIMTKSLITTRPDEELKVAERLLIEHRVSGVPVVEQGNLVGVLSRSDIARVEVLMQSLDEQVSDRLNWDVQADGFEHAARPEFQDFRERIAKLKVRDAMHDQVVTCTPSTPVQEVAAEMVRHHIHRIIVVDGLHPVGIISSLDMTRLVAERRPFGSK